MKTFGKIVLLISLLLNSVAAFSQWKSLNPKPTSSWLNTVWMISDNIVVTAGDNGIILKSTDGGTSWELINSNTSNNILDIYFSDSKNGWAVGTEGLILNTTDGGNSWNKQISGELVTFYSVSFASSLVGVAVGAEGAVMKTIDGGTTWERKSISTTETLYGVDFLDASNVVLVGTAGKIFKSVNAGTSWSIRTSNTTANLNDVDFVDVNTGWAIGENSNVFKTVDGGTTWNGLTNTYGTYIGIKMLNSTTGYLVGSYGTVKKTTDGGTTWNQVLTLASNPDDYDPLKNGYSGVFFINDQKGIAVGNKGSMVLTTNGGTAFTNLNYTFTTDTFKKVYFINKDTGFLFGDKSFYKSFNAGVSWTKVFAFTNYNAPSIKFFDSKNGVAIRGDQAYKTTDGGNTWTKDASVKLDGVIMSQTKAVRLNGSAPQYTTNGGTTWNNSTLDNYYDYFNDVVMVNENVGYATANYENKVVKITEGGKTWTGTAGTVSWPNKLYFVNETTGWVSGSGGIYKTTNSGANWTLQNTNANIRDIKFINEQEGYFITKEGYVYKTTNGGDKWESQISNTSQEMNSLFLLDGTHGWAVGSFASIISMASFKPTLTVTAESKIRKYGESNPSSFTFSYSGFIDGDTKANITEPTISCAATKTSDAGIYPITLSGGASTKYAIKLVNGQLTVEKVTLTISAESKSRKPNEANPAFTCTYSGFVNGDDENDLDVKPSITCTATAGSPIGVYDINVSGASDNNYTFNYVKGSLIVSNKEIQTITFPAIVAKTYGNASFNLNATSTSGLDVSYSSSNTSVATISGSKVTILSAGTTEITASQSGNDTYSLAAEVKRTLTVQKAILTVKADSKSKDEGADNPQFTYSYNGFFNGDDENDLDTKPTLSCSATKNSPSGTYSIVPSGGDDNNYDFNYVNGKLYIGTTSIGAGEFFNIAVYPTIIKDILMVSSNNGEPLALNIYSLTGSLIMAKSIKGGLSAISLNNLTKGLYLVKITSKNYSLTQRIIKE